MSTYDRTGNLYVQGRYLYVTSDSGPNNDGAFSIIDISSPVSPVLISQINSDVRLKFAEGVIVVGNYAFVAGYNATSLVVIDVSDPYAPSIVAVLTDANNLILPVEMAISGQYLFIACSHTISGKSNLTVVSIANPLAPVVVGTLVNSGIAGAVWPEIQGKYLFLAARGSVATFSAIDISNPTAPTLVSTFGTTWPGGGNSITGVAVRGKYAYLGVGNANAVVVVDISNPASMTSPGNYTSATYLPDVSNVHIAGTLLYVTTYGNSLVVLDVTVPTTPTFVSAMTFVATVQTDHLEIDGNYAYIADTSYPNLGGVIALEIGGAVQPTASFGKLYADEIHVGKDVRVARNLLVGGGFSANTQQLCCIVPAGSYFEFVATGAATFRIGWQWYGTSFGTGATVGTLVSGTAYGPTATNTFLALCFNVPLGSSITFYMDTSNPPTTEVGFISF